jgi:threonine dehydratase
MENRDEEYEKVFGVKPKKPKKAKKSTAASSVKKTPKTSKQLEPVAVEEPGAWGYDAKKPAVDDKKTKKNINFLIGLVVVFVALLVINWISQLISMIK